MGQHEYDLEMQLSYERGQAFVRGVLDQLRADGVALVLSESQDGSVSVSIKPAVEGGGEPG